MQVGSVAASGPKNQSALKLITDIVETRKADLSGRAAPGDTWLSTTSGSSVSSRSAAAIQDLVQGNANGMTTFKRLGGPDQTLPTDEYEFFTRGIPATLEDLRDVIVSTRLTGYPQIIDQMFDAGRPDDAKRYSDEFEAFKRSLANGTFKVELLDDRVAGDNRWYGLRYIDGKVGGMAAETVTPLDWDAFQKIYGNGNGGYDGHIEVGNNALIRDFVIRF